LHSMILSFALKIAIVRSKALLASQFVQALS
jgi:hypothetical protein